MYNGVEFYEDDYMADDKKRRRDTRPFFVKIVMDFGLAKNEKQANYVLILIAGIFLLMSVILMAQTFGGSVEPPKGFKGNVPDLPEYQNPPIPDIY